jgi:hypothetical protein
VASVDGSYYPDPDGSGCDTSDEETLPWPTMFGITFQHQPKYLSAPVWFSGFARRQGSGTLTYAQYTATATSSGGDTCFLSIRLTPVEALLLDVFGAVQISDDNVTIVGCSQFAQ